MPVVAPQTKYGQIIDAVNERLRTGKPVGEHDVFWFNRLKQDAERLLKIDPADGHIALAALMQLKWDEDKASYHVRCAKTARPTIGTTTQEVALLSNFGRFSKASPLLEEALDPRNGFFVDNYLAALSCGAFRAASANLRKAIDMEINLPDLPVDAVNKAINVLSAAEITDEQTAMALDVAGEILRERKLFWIGESVEVNVDDDPGHLPTVFFTFRIRETAEIAASMTYELYERLFERYPDHPSCFNLGFRSAIPE